MCRIVVLCALLTVAIQCSGECALIDTAVAEFSFSGNSRVDALVNFAQRFHMCLGIRNLRKSAFSQPVSITVKGKTARETLREIIDDPTVEITQDPTGVVAVYGSPTLRSLYDRPISEFKIGRITLQTAAFGLRVRLERDLDPSIQGIAGAFNSGDRTNLVGPLDESGRPVAQILNKLVADSHGASWIATLPDKKANNISEFPIWLIVERSKAPSEYVSQIAEIARRYPETK